MCMQAGLGLSRAETIHYAKSMIDVVVQMDRQAGRREITDILFPAATHS
jgi:type IV secretion system protein VirB11